MLATEVLRLRLSLKLLIFHVLGKNQIHSVHFCEFGELVLFVALLRDLWEKMGVPTDWKGLQAFRSVLNIN